MYENQYHFEGNTAEIGVPQEIKRWNWGAFSLNIIWGIGNRSYLTLLMLIPIFNLVWMFICGAKGNEWAWKNGNYKTVEEFWMVQSTWNRAGFVFFIIWLIEIVLMVIYMATAGAALMALMGSGMY